MPLEGECAVFSELPCPASSGPNPARQLLGKAVGAALRQLTE